MGKPDSVLKKPLFPQEMVDEYAALGWNLLPIVHNSKSAGSVVGDKWQTKSSCDLADIEKWVANPKYNIALHLGNISGVIDIEADTEEGNNSTHAMFKGIKTPCFKSKRGIHYLFLWNKELSRMSKTAYHIGEVEFRIGGNRANGEAKGCITILPPAQEREWIVSPVECALQAIPDDVLQLIIDQEKDPEELHIISPGDVITDWDARLSRYLDKVPGAISGQRGHDHTFRVACAIINDMQAPFEVSLKHLKLWNMKCSPPWEEKDLYRKLEEAAANASNEPGCKNNPRSDVDISNIIPSSPVRRKIRKKKEINFPEGCYKIPGLIGEIVDYTLKTARYPQPELALGGAMSLMSVLTGRKIESNDGCRTNLYVLAISESSSGKKWPARINHKIIEATGIQKNTVIGPNQIGSAPGIVSHLAINPSLIFMVDEVGFLLKSSTSERAQPHQRNVIAILMDLFSSSDHTWISYAYADTRKTKTIEQPHMVLFGQATSTVFWDSLTMESVSEGLLGRLMVLEGREKVKSVKGNRPNTPVPDSIVEQVKWWLQGELSPNLGNIAPDPLFIPLIQEAQDRFDSYAEQVEDKADYEDEKRRSIWRRGIEKTLKFAMLFCASRNSYKQEMEISLEDMNLAIMLSNFHTRFMLQGALNVSDNDWQKKVNYIERYLERSDGLVNYTKLSRDCRKIKLKDRTDILKDLEHQGKIRIRQAGGEGRLETMVELLDDGSDED